MRKHYLILLGQIILCSTLSAQDNITYTKMADSLLFPVSKTQIATGILYDRVAPFAALHSFKNTDTSSYWHFIQAYSELCTAAYNTAGMMKVEKIDTISSAMYYTNSVVPIGVLYYDFNLIDTFAITNNLFYKGSDSLLHDVAGRTSNPFKLKTITVAAALPKDTLNYGTGSVIFKYTSQLFLNNKGVTITSIYADFGTGNQNLTSGNTVTISYPTSGMKTIKFTITYSNSQTATVYSKIYLRSQSVASRLGQPVTPDETVDFDDALYGYQGYGESAKKYNHGSYGIYYHRTSPGGAKEMILKKPIIILDGFDPNDSRQPADLFGKYLQYTITNNFGKEMLDKGYDVIVLNFPEKVESQITIPGLGVVYQQKRPQGADFIQRNAFLLVTLIEKINTKLTENGSTEKLVVIGPSMGGLISRYALRWMELNGKAHNTRLWVSFDAPHKGANIPIGDQYFIDFYASKANNQMAKEGRDNSLNSAAAKQMLLHHFSANTTTPSGAANFRNNWQTEIDNLGYPQNLRKIALINGAINGTTQGTACQNIFRLNVQLYTPNMFFFFAGFINVAEGNVWFTGSNGSACNVFKGWAKAPFISNTKTAAAPSSSKSYDIVPGGYFNTQEQLVGKRVTDSYIPLLGAITTIFLGTRTYTNSNVLKATHSFIPTFSALGMNITNKDLSENLYNRDLVCSGETPFQAYYAPQVNQEHITLTTENVAWIKNEIDGIPQMSTVDYAAMYPIVKTAGADPVCTTATYQVNNLPAGSTVQWSASPSGRISLSPNGASVTVTKTGNGSVTLKAKITGCANPELTKQIQTGPITPDFEASIQNGWTICEDDMMEFIATPVDPTSTYEWQITGGTIYTGQGTKKMRARSNGATEVRVTMRMNVPGCGYSNYADHTYFLESCYGLWSISPNPAQDMITITAGEQTGMTAKTGAFSTSASSIAQVKIYNAYGVTIKTVQYIETAKQVRVNVADLAPGLYFIEVSNGAIKQTKKLIITR